MILFCVALIEDVCVSSPENVPRLFDLVRVKEEKVLPAFYFALRDTLVATDIDQATRIAYGRQRFRVVTLGGQLIDQSGKNGNMRNGLIIEHSEKLEPLLLEISEALLVTVPHLSCNIYHPYTLASSGSYNENEIPT